MTTKHQITEVPANAFKCLGERALDQIYEYVVDFWEDRADYLEWHTVIRIMVPKKGDLSDPN